jgi:uncharacterized protein with ParB-like and HNH nuclease domain
MSNQAILEPRVTYMENILADIDRGLLKVPRFQRREVWDWQAQKDLLCSIYEGLPIGSILLWQTNLDKISYRDSLGPFQLPTIEQNQHQSYILDGLQRLTTLYSMVFHPSARKKPQANLDDYAVFCNLDETNIDDLFLRQIDLDRLKIAKDDPQYFPLKWVFQTKEMMRFQKKIDSEDELRIDKVDEIVAAFKNYKLPIVPLQSDDQNLVTKSFERVNTRGQIMSETHMLNALSYQQDQFELLALIDQFREQYLMDYPKWREGLEESFILMRLKIAVGMGPYDMQTAKDCA